MQTRDIDLIAFGPEHLEGAHALSQQAQWPHRLEDWALALELSQGMVALSETGKVVGTVLVTPFEEDCATINMVIVDEAMRGRGLGRKLMEAALSMGGERPLRLVATAEGMPLYQKLGFEATADVVQHQGPVAKIPMPQAVRIATTDDLEAICALDRQAFGADRSKLIVALMTKGQMVVMGDTGAVTGYAALRAFGRGEVIGPVVADDAPAARALISFFMAERQNQFLRIDTTADTDLGPWLTELGLSPVGGGIAMRRPNNQPIDNHKTKTYALANQAFG